MNPVSCCVKLRLLDTLSAAADCEVTTVAILKTAGKYKQTLVTVKEDIHWIIDLSFLMQKIGPSLMN